MNTGSFQMDAYPAFAAIVRLSIPLAETVAIYEEVKQVVYKRFGLRLNIPTEIVLVDRNQLSQILLQHSELEEKLDPTSTLGVYCAERNEAWDLHSKRAAVPIWSYG
jgi:hypothetical protein